VSNEPADASEIVTNEPTLAAAVGLESPTYMETAEPNSANAPALAALGSGGRGVDMTADINHGVDSDFNEEIDRQKSGEWVRAGLVGMVAIRAEKLRELNREPEQCHKNGGFTISALPCGFMADVSTH
jgi:hypothetical protein